MFSAKYNLVLYLTYLFFAIVTAHDSKCEVRLRINSGWICGRERLGDNGIKYASFRGIPYAQQPLGKLRFQKLKSVKPWTHDFNASEDGPACPQDNKPYEIFFKSNMTMSEACIYANVHVPTAALQNSKGKGGLPIIVVIHGGSFQMGSGNSDFVGPEYLVSKGVIVVTFNYRLNVFGFLSLNSSKIPGNNGLRDQVTLLKWVQKNAKAFGGDPKDVTLYGQSAGAACAHLLSLSNVTKGLFKRLIVMSGTAIPAFYSSSPIYANQIARSFLTILGINETDPDVIHDKLVKIPIEEITRANSIIQNEAGIFSFVPVIESELPGVTRILDDDPITLIKLGRGKEYPTIVGFTSAECEFFKTKLQQFDIVRKIEENPRVILPARIPFATLPNVSLALAQKVIDHYFDGDLTLERYMDVCRDTLFVHSAFKLAQWRAEIDSAPTYLYQYSYESQTNLIKIALQLQYNGSAHLEDFTYIFRENAVLSSKDLHLAERDELMKDWITDFIINFIRYNAPTAESKWPSVDASLLNYQDINMPALYRNTEPTQVQQDMIDLFDELDDIAGYNS